jgi:hypothetical protein
MLRTICRERFRYFWLLGGQEVNNRTRCADKLPMMNGVPFFRDLKRCRKKDHSEAAKEVASTFVLAIIPVWLGALLMMLIPRASALHYLQEFLASGEVLLVSAALIGPSIYVLTKNTASFQRD